MSSEKKILITIVIFLCLVAMLIVIHGLYIIFNLNNNTDNLNGKYYKTGTIKDSILTTTARGYYIHVEYNIDSIRVMNVYKNKVKVIKDNDTLFIERSELRCYSRKNKLNK